MDRLLARKLTALAKMTKAFRFRITAVKSPLTLILYTDVSTSSLRNAADPHCPPPTTSLNKFLDLLPLRFLTNGTSATLGVDADRKAAISTYVKKALGS